VKARQRKRKLQRINSADLAPLIAQGYTEDAIPEEAFQHAEAQRPLEKVGSKGKLEHMKDVDARLARDRGGFASFVATSDSKAVWTTASPTASSTTSTRPTRPAG
jgi:hypothetical protein